MMLPSQAPMLWRYRQAVDRTGEPRLGRLTTIVAVGYFLVWAVLGMAACAIGGVVLIAGALQLTAWKTRHLACCREAPPRGRLLPATASMAWRHGWRLGLHCSCSCVGLTAILLVDADAPLRC